MGLEIIEKAYKKKSKEGEQKRISILKKLSATLEKLQHGTYFEKVYIFESAINKEGGFSYKY